MNSFGKGSALICRLQSRTELTVSGKHDWVCDAIDLSDWEGS